MGISFDVVFMQIFFRWGLIAHKLRHCLFVGTFLLTGFLSIGFLWIQEQTTKDPQFVFSPEDARWRYERAVLSEHWPLDEQHFWPGKSYDYYGYIDVIAAGKPDPEFGRPNLLLSQYINEVERINQYIIHNITVPIDHNGKEYEIGFLDLCMSYDWKCYLNDHVIMLMPETKWHNLQGQLADFAKDIIEQEVKITYPIGWRGTEPIYFGALVGGPHLTDEEGRFDYVKAIRLTYNVRDGKVGNISQIWRKKLAEFLSDKENPPSEILEFGFYHNTSLPEGLQDVADALTPKLAITSSILLTFCLLCSIVLLNHKGFTGIDWVRSKPILGFAALICPLLATASAWGLVLWTGGLYNAIVNVSPFIVISIGVDDAFLMNAAWHRTNPELSVARRLAETLSEAAVSITITSLTDILSFGIGTYTTLPGVRLFCIYTFWGILFTYLYQITYFTAVMAYAGEMEDKGKHSLFGIETLQPKEADTSIKRWLFSGSTCRKQNLGSTQPDSGTNVMSKGKVVPKDTNLKLSIKQKTIDFLKNIEFETSQHNDDHHLDSFHSRETLVNRFFREIYGPFLLTNPIKWYILGCYSIYLSLAIYGCSQVKEGLNPKNLVRKQFYLTNFYSLIDETFWEEGLQMQVVINNPPNFFEPKQRERFHVMMDEFENTEYTMKHNATMFWLYAYERQLREDMDRFNVSMPTTSQEWYERCREWLLTAGGRRLWELDMDWGKNNSDPNDWNRLKAFRLQLGLRNYKSATDHTNSCKLMRKIASHYPEFNVTTFHEYYPFADQYLELKPALIRNCIIAALCMMFIAMLMIPSIRAAFAIVLAIASIDIGVLGYMTLWGVNLESVSMITIIMSIGFSVDLSAHIAYAYVKSEGSSNEKAIGALETLGWPVFLGAFSTIVGITVLATVDALIVQIFFKTTFLVIAFSLMHGIIFLPVFLTVVLSESGNKKTKSELETMEEKPKKTIIFDSPRDLTKRRPSAKNSQGSFDLEMVEVDNYSVDSNALEEVDINLNFRIEAQNPILEEGKNGKDESLKAEIFEEYQKQQTKEKI